MLDDEIFDKIMLTFEKFPKKWTTGRGDWESSRDALNWFIVNSSEHLTNAQINRLVKVTKGKRLSLRESLVEADNFDESSLKLLGKTKSHHALKGIILNDKISFEAKKKYLTKATIRNLLDVRYFYNHIIEQADGEIKEYLKSFSDIKDIIE